jgi:heat shock protein HslJ
MKCIWMLAPLVALLPLIAEAQVPAALDVVPTPSAPTDTGQADTAVDWQGAVKAPVDPAQVDPSTPEADVGTWQLMQQLTNHRWTLTAANDAQAQPMTALFPAAGRPYQFSFSNTGISVQGPCNTLAGGFQINAEGLLEIPPLRATMMACEAELMAADTALGALLTQPLRMEFMAGAIAQLQLQTPANDTLLLEGQITPEALYGPGTTLFLEIDAQRLACRNPRSTQTTCLQARELAFDEQGLRIPPPGPWKPFYDPIDGYTHVPGERNVLRVKRFDRGPGSGGTAPYLYVLDLVVETEVVPQ